MGFVGFRPVLDEVPVLGDALEGILLLDRVCSVGEALWFLGIWSQEVLPGAGCAIPSTTRGHPEPRYAPRPVQAETRECRREMSRRGSALGRWCAPRREGLGDDVDRAIRQDPFCGGLPRENVHLYGGCSCVISAPRTSLLPSSSALLSVAFH